MRKIDVVVALAAAALCSTIALAKSSDPFGGTIKITGTASAPAAGGCASPAYASNCPTAPSTTQSCTCIQVAKAKAKGPSLGTGTANVYLDEDDGDGDGTDGSKTASNCVPVFGAAVITDSTAAQATVNITGTLCGSSFGGGYSVASGGSAWGTVSGTLSGAGSVTLNFSPQ